MFSVICDKCGEVWTLGTVEVADPTVGSWTVDGKKFKPNESTLQWPDGVHLCPGCAYYGSGEAERQASNLMYACDLIRPLIFASPNVSKALQETLTQWEQNTKADGEHIAGEVINWAIGRQREAIKSITANPFGTVLLGEGGEKPEGESPIPF